jgi:UDP-GlcNAc3NAcA epimerase
MLKIVTVIGARPQIIKASAISRAICEKFSDKIKEVIIHTGQHYDDNMSAVFFEEMQIPLPDYNLQVGSGRHGYQTAEMIKGIEEILIKEKPDGVLLYGDTNSTLAGAIAASKLNCKIIHVEAGLRSFNKAMPEEINRILCDHCASLLFSPTATGYNNLIREGFKADVHPPYTADNPKIYHCGDVMLDNTLYFSKIAAQNSKMLDKTNLKSGSYVLATIHRDNNTDNPERLTSIFSALLGITNTKYIDIVLPLHPRTSKILKENLGSAVYKCLKENSGIKIIEAVSYLEMIELEKNAALIITDSGGVQKEAYFLHKPCIILRPQTEWLEIIETGNAVIADADENKITAAASDFLTKKNSNFLSIFGDGKAAEFICGEMVKQFI